MTPAEQQSQRMLGGRAVVVGLGLIGGSLAAALRRHDLYQEVVGVDLDAEVVATAVARGFIDEGVTALDAVAGDADLLVLATPVRQIIALLAYVGPLLKPGAIVMDVGGTKAQVVAAMNALPAAVQAMGGHPMSGRMTAGLDQADAGLFQNKTFILTPVPRTTPSTQALVERLVRAIGGRPLILDPRQHDEVVALVSHLPRVVPLALIDAALAADSSLLWAVAAGGFRDSTNKVTDNVTMWLDVLLTNPQAIVAAIRTLQLQLDDLAQKIDTGNEAVLRDNLERAAATWHRHFGRREMDDPS